MNAGSNPSEEGHLTDERQRDKDPRDPKSGIIWKEVPGWDSYQVSNFGQVKKIRDRWGRAVEAPHLAKRPQADGYRKLTLSQDGRHQQMPVSRLVLMAFDRMPEPGEDAHHKQSPKHNDGLWNLEWRDSRRAHPTLETQQKPKWRSAEDRDAKIVRVAKGVRVEVWSELDDKERLKTHIRFMRLNPSYGWYPTKTGMILSEQSHKELLLALTEIAEDRGTRDESDD